MAEDDGQQGAENEENSEELRRNLNLKQKLFEKVAIRATRTLTDADIIASVSEGRVPGSALLGGDRMRFANAKVQQPVSDEDPRDAILYSDFDFSPDPVTVTDMDPSDSSHHPFPA
jgi:hypothetical protein